MIDTRNVIDIYKNQPLEDIVADLDRNDILLEIAIDNVEHDFNMGTIVRSANAFGVRHVHIIGRRQWNKRGAMATDKYLHVHYHATVDEFLTATVGKELVAIDNVAGSEPLGSVRLPKQAILIFGAEGPGIRPELLERCSKIAAIEQFGSTRSINVGVAAGIAMYSYMQQNILQ
ncbi:MAG: TrmH family RNA methyltransferase [Candidatus Saccharimonas sp.]